MEIAMNAPPNYDYSAKKLSLAHPCAQRGKPQENIPALDSGKSKDSTKESKSSDSRASSAIPAGDSSSSPQSAKSDTQLQIVSDTSSFSQHFEDDYH